MTVCTLITLYALWPYWSSWRLYTAVSDRDTTAIAGAVEWPTFRQNLKSSLRDRLRSKGDRITVDTSAGEFQGQLSFSLTPETIDQLVDTRTTWRIFRTGRVDQRQETSWRNRAAERRRRCHGTARAAIVVGVFHLTVQVRAARGDTAAT